MSPTAVTSCSYSDAKTHETAHRNLSAEKISLHNLGVPPTLLSERNPVPCYYRFELNKKIFCWSYRWLRINGFASFQGTDATMGEGTVWLIRLTRIRDFWPRFDCLGRCECLSHRVACLCCLGEWLTSFKDRETCTCITNNQRAHGTLATCTLNAQPEKCG